MKFAVETIGCQQNEYDASRLAIFLKSAGFVETTAQDAKVIFILACSVRQMAVDRIFGRVKNWAKDKLVIITSCLTPEDQRKITDRGAHYWKFGDVKSLSVILGLDPGIQKNTEDSCFRRNDIQQSSSSCYVPIMTGCNNFCSYCIVPHIRGREKSRPVADIIKETKNLLSHFRTAQYGSEKPEIVLLGQNVNSYKGSSPQSSVALAKDDKFGFAKLLKKINDLPGDFGISFMSNHPKDMTSDVIEAIATLPKIKKEIHLPLQSGSDRILKLMNRPNTSKQYLNLVSSLKSHVSKLKLTTDIIVGFPGETEEDFQKTLEVCKKVGYSLAYVNKYSPRKGTAAYKLGDPILWSEKQRRWKILNELINKK